jgi:hypothetical protein
MLERVDPVIFTQSNAKSPGVPGGSDIARQAANVSHSVSEKAWMLGYKAGVFAASNNIKRP